MDVTDRTIWFLIFHAAGLLAIFLQNQRSQVYIALFVHSGHMAYQGQKFPYFILYISSLLPTRLRLGRIRASFPIPISDFPLRQGFAVDESQMDYHKMKKTALKKSHHR